uniref:Uncharacterized protein n=1 Tax=Cucumis sativus TaxID=3659 RepID=A0A0A0KZB0_CUCSA
MEVLNRDWQVTSFFLKIREVSPYIDDTSIHEYYPDKFQQTWICGEISGRLRGYIADITWIFHGYSATFPTF